MTISTEALKAILFGCEGVTPGPWSYSGKVEEDDWGQYFRCVEQSDGDGVTILADHTISDVEAAHVARLDPDTIKAIVSELLAYRKAALDELRKPVDEVRE